MDSGIFWNCVIVIKIFYCRKGIFYCFVCGCNKGILVQGLWCLLEMCVDVIMVVVLYYRFSVVYWNYVWV